MVQFGFVIRFDIGLLILVQIQFKLLIRVELQQLLLKKHTHSQQIMKTIQDTKTTNSKYSTTKYNNKENFKVTKLIQVNKNKGKLLNKIKSSTKINY